MRRRRWRPILAAAVVLAYAGWAYLHDGYHGWDLAAMAYRFDVDGPHYGTVADIPADVRRLDGRRVVVDGFMIPMDQAEQIRQFALVPSLWGSSQSPPTLQQTLVVDAAVPQAYCPDRPRVFGRLHVGLAWDDGYVVGLYRLDVDRVELANPPPAARWPVLVGTAVVATAVTAVAFGRARLRRLRDQGRCVACGYDLRASPDRCPECGQHAGRRAVPMDAGGG